MYVSPQARREHLIREFFAASGERARWLFGAIRAHDDAQGTEPVGPTAYAALDYKTYVAYGEHGVPEDEFRPWVARLI